MKFSTPTWRTLTAINIGTFAFCAMTATVSEGWVLLLNVFCAGFAVGCAAHAFRMIGIERAMDDMNKAFDGIRERADTLIQEQHQLIQRQHDALKQIYPDDDVPTAPRLH
jgi:hypothetical protein